ncbi:MAG: GNAT family N-acetyltransferase [Pseudomonadota bacterium]
MLRGVRETVFIREQGIPDELEWDGIDEICHHVLSLDKQGNAAGCGRITPADGTNTAHIGRMAVLAEWRGQKLGTAMLQALVEYAHGRGYARVDLNAQVHAIPFYRRYGFAEIGVGFIDAGLPHIRMQLVLR